LRLADRTTFPWRKKSSIAISDRRLKRTPILFVFIKLSRALLFRAPEEGLLRQEGPEIGIRRN
jgi:hypothetical protein